MSEPTSYLGDERAREPSGSLADSFEKLLGRQPTDKEVATLYRVKAALGLSDNDALWLVVMVLQHYQTLYEKVPHEIERVAARTLERVRMAAEATAVEAAEVTKRMLAEAVAAAAHDVARDVAGKQKLQWLLATVVTCCVTVSAVGMSMYWQGMGAGEKRGYAQGYASAKDEKAAAAWANTPEGRRAYGLAMGGSIRYLAECSRPGWVVKDGLCLPKVMEDGTLWGWRVR